MAFSALRATWKYPKAVTLHSSSQSTFYQWTPPDVEFLLYSFIFAMVLDNSSHLNIGNLWYFVHWAQELLPFGNLLALKLIVALGLL